MTKQEALLYFEVSEDFQQMELLDLMDEKLFHLKNEVLQKINVPSLLEKRKKECERMLEALEALNMKEDTKAAVFHFSPLPSDAIAFLEHYESQISAAKLIAFHAKTPQELIASIEFLITIQEHYLSTFVQVFSAFGPFEENQSISVQTTFESGEVLRKLKSPESHSEAVLSEITQLIQSEASRVLKLNGLK